MQRTLRIARGVFSLDVVDVSWRQVAGMAEHCPSLTVLDLSNNARRVGLPENMELAGKAVGKLIKSNTALTELR